MHHTLTLLLLYLSKKTLANIGHTPAEQAISPQKPINRLLKTDWYNGTTLMSNEPPCIVGDSTF